MSICCHQLLITPFHLPMEMQSNHIQNASGAWFNKKSTSAVTSGYQFSWPLCWPCCAVAYTMTFLTSRCNRTALNLQQRSESWKRARPRCSRRTIPPVTPRTPRFSAPVAMPPWTAHHRGQRTPSPLGVRRTLLHFTCCLPCCVCILPSGWVCPDGPRCCDVSPFWMQSMFSVQVL